ncbi:hypothetical protein Hdeb2414_s0015g00446351 [Helianthus debilis subsp. tardiflorus]
MTLIIQRRGRLLPSVVALSSYEEKEEQFKEQVKMIEMSRKSGHAAQANGEGGSLA